MGRRSGIGGTTSNARSRGGRPLSTPRGRAEGDAAPAAQPSDAAAKGGGGGNTARQLLSSRPPTAGPQPTPRGRLPSTPRNNGGARPATPASLPPLLSFPHHKQFAAVSTGAASGSASEPPPNHPKTPRASPLNITIPPLRLSNGGENQPSAGTVMPSPQGARLPTRGRGSRSGHNGMLASDRSATANSQARQQQSATEARPLGVSPPQGGLLQPIAKDGRKRPNQSSLPESSRLDPDTQARSKRGTTWKQQQQQQHDDGSTDATATLSQQLQDNAALQAKVQEVRASASGELQQQLLEAVMENDRLNKQLHMLHHNAAQLRQAIADARSLQMHLQQECADSRLLAVGLQAQLRDAEASTSEAAADEADVRHQGLQLVRNATALFQLSAVDVFGSGAVAAHTQDAASSKDSLDSRSFSLMQNTHALLSHRSNLEPSRSNLAGGKATTTLTPRGRNVRIMAGMPAQSPQQQKDGGFAKQPASPAPSGKGATGARTDAAVSKSAKAPAAAANDSNQPRSQASSTLANRIASMQTKFAAAAQLLEEAVTDDGPA